MTATGPTTVRRVWAGTPLWLRLVAAVLALVALAQVAAGVATVTALRGYLLNQVDNQLRVASEPLLHGPRYRPGPGPPPEVRGPGRFRLPSAFYLAITDESGAVAEVLESPLLAGRLSLPQWTPQQAAARHGRAITVPAAGGGQWRLLYTPLPDGSGSALVAISLAGVDATLARLKYLELVIGGVVLVLLAGVGFLAVRSSLRPLAGVKDTAEAIAAGDLTRRVPEHPPRTEVGQLSGALNGMLAQIESAFRIQQASEAAARSSEERMRRFVADASHKLRTPLTSIRGFAELYRQGAADDVPQLMSRIESAAARMGLLVEDLLLLARLDAQRELVRAPVDLVTLAADAVHDARAVPGPADHPGGGPGRAGAGRPGRWVPAAAGAEQPDDQRAHPHSGRHAHHDRTVHRTRLGRALRRRPGPWPGPTGRPAGVRALLPGRLLPYPLPRRRDRPGPVHRGRAHRGTRRSRRARHRTRLRSGVPDPAPPGHAAGSPSRADVTADQLEQRRCAP